MFKFNNRDTRTMPLTLFWCLECQLWTYLTHFSSVSVIEFDEVNFCWEIYISRGTENTEQKTLVLGPLWWNRNAKLFNPFSANFAKWSNTPKQFVGNLPMNCLSVFDHFVGLALKGLSVQTLTQFLVVFSRLDQLILFYFWEKCLLILSSWMTISGYNYWTFFAITGNNTYHRKKIIFNYTFNYAN